MERNLCLYKLKINVFQVASGNEEASLLVLVCTCVSVHHGTVTFGDWKAVPLNDLRVFDRHTRKLSRAKEDVKIYFWIWEEKYFHRIAWPTERSLYLHN